MGDRIMELVNITADWKPMTRFPCRPCKLEDDDDEDTAIYLSFYHLSSPVRRWQFGWR